MGVYARAIQTGALPVAGTNLLSSNIKPLFDVCEFRVHFYTSKAGKVYMKRIFGGTTISECISGSGTIGAGECANYFIPIRAIEEYNFTFSATDGTYYLQLDEVSP